MLDRHFSPVPRSYSYSDLLVKDTVTVLSDEYEDSLKQHFVNEMQYLPQVIIKKQRIKKNYLRSSFMMWKKMSTN